MLIAPAGKAPKKAVGIARAALMKAAKNRGEVAAPAPPISSSIDLGSTRRALRAALSLREPNAAEHQHQPDGVVPAERLAKDCDAEDGAEDRDEIHEQAGSGR